MFVCAFGVKSWCSKGEREHGRRRGKSGKQPGVSKECAERKEGTKFWRALKARMKSFPLMWKGAREAIKKL